MIKAIRLAGQISKEIDKNWFPIIEENNLHKIFESVFSLDKANIEECNKIFCYIIYAYSPESLWLDLNKDRNDNKLKILHNLDADVKTELYQSIINNNNEKVGIAIFNYLEELKSWKWRAVFDLLDYSSKMFRFASQETEAERKYDKMDKEGTIKELKEEMDLEAITKVNKEKGILLEGAIQKRRQADVLLEEIRKEFVVTDSATQSDFGFQFTETTKKRDIMSWSEFRRHSNEKKKLSMQ